MQSCIAWPTERQHAVLAPLDSLYKVGRPCSRYNHSSSRKHTTRTPKVAVVDDVLFQVLPLHTHSLSCGAWGGTSMESPLSML